MRSELLFFENQEVGFVTASLKQLREGSILWDNEIFSTSGTFGTDQHTKYIGVDANNNYYVEGQYKNHMYIYHTGSTESTNLDYHQYSAGGSYYAHVLKFNTDGALQWTTRSYITEYGLYKGVFHHDVKTDNDGNTYITGSSNYGGAGFSHVHNVENADGSTFSSDQAQTFFLKKLNANGFIDWIIGTEEDINTESKYPSGWQLEVKNGVVTTIGKIKANITTPENVIFKSSDAGNITASLTANDLFINSYTTEGILNKVTIFNSIIDDPYNILYKGLISKDIDNYYIGSNFGSSFSNRDGRINFLNSEFCGTIYNNTLSVEEFENQVKVSVIPNPNSGAFKLHLNTFYSNCKVSLYNVLGQLISKEEFINNSEINLKITGEIGIYFAEISIDDNFKQSVKVLVK
ncbi:T9SS type A sorting domain-containing protein [Lacinutrix neustonica]|uniref:T9SS type A sorting domain-containing protein n=1 Tax=Lacinutrix neustonica TaxID=2980107 RepID=A0A9E8MYA1_9FLAO|nr:T9SS type A sorting domain-containing protein [Lacinutrix neustonica]WAC02475.1 T9SS type A sorting domain-containing protein [Lacinutrix neustonica]